MRRPSLVRGTSVLVAGATLGGCGGAGATLPKRTETPSALGSPDDHRRARAWLRSRRSDAPTEATGWNVDARFVDERTGLAQAGRGALAVRPPDALRLQLVGPAGKLALDVWVGASGGKLASPALGSSERTRAGEHRPGRPTGFLAWWMLHRYEGRLLAVEKVGAEERLLVRAASGELIRFVRAGTSERETLQAVRTTAGDEETVIHEGAFCGHSRYRSARARIRVDVRCGERTPPPRARAFDDPDGAP